MAYTRRVLGAFRSQRFGSYQLVAQLGRGGMADVYRAVHTGAAGFERVVVVKKILGPYDSNPAFVSMFINEAKIAAQLTHPNIVQVYELGEVNGEYFMAMEYVKGLDLVHALHWLGKQAPGARTFPPAAAAFVARELCRGLACAHEYVDPAGIAQPIIHRDVSPQNVMLTWDAQVKLLDFGIAKAMFVAREETRSGALKGKAAYMAPEQVDGLPPGPESDVWATGVVLYEMLVEGNLFKGEHDFDTISRVKTLALPVPSRVNPAVPEELSAIVLRALERNRGQRYQRAAQMARDLDGYLQGVRFTVDDFAAFMTASFPAELREQISAERTADTPRSTSRAETSAGRRARELALQLGPRSSSRSGSAASHRPPGQTRAAASSTWERWRQILVAVVIGGVVFGAAAWWIASRRAPPPGRPSLPPLATIPRVEAHDLSTTTEQPVEPRPENAQTNAPPRKPTKIGDTPPKVEAFGDAPKVGAFAGAPKIETFDEEPKIETFDEESTPGSPSKQIKIDTLDE